MDHYSILTPDPSAESSAKTLPLAEQFLPDLLAGRSCADALRFPAEDGGHSLGDWARRDLEATLQLLADRAQYITGASGAAIALREGQHIVCRASSGHSVPELGAHLDVTSGLSGESVRTGKTLRCDDARQDSRVNQESCQQLGIASFAVMPFSTTAA